MTPAREGRPGSCGFRLLTLDHVLEHLAGRLRRPVDAQEEGERWSDVDRAHAVDDAAASAVPASASTTDTRAAARNVPCMFTLREMFTRFGRYPCCPKNCENAIRCPGVAASNW